MKLEQILKDNDIPPYSTEGEIIRDIFDCFEKKIKEAEESQMLTMQLAEDILNELKSEREIKKYLTENVLPELKSKIKEFKSRTCKNCIKDNNCLVNSILLKFYSVEELKDFGCNKWESK